MIDARVDEAVKQHRQKMNWLHAEAVSGEGGPGAGGAAAEGGLGKIGFTPPPQAFSENILEVESPSRDSEMGDELGNGTKSEGSSLAEGKPKAPPPKEGTPV